MGIKINVNISSSFLVHTVTLLKILLLLFWQRKQFNAERRATDWHKKSMFTLIKKSIKWKPREKNCRLLSYVWLFALFLLLFFYIYSLFNLLLTSFFLSLFFPPSFFCIRLSGWSRDIVSCIWLVTWRWDLTDDLPKLLKTESRFFFNLSFILFYFSFFFLNFI